MLSILILSYNRREALRRTLREVAGLGAQIIVADNASADGTREMLAAEFPHVEVLALDANIGVAAFNRAAALARGERLLILDDDSWPDPASLAGAMALLDARPQLAAVALAPVHPKTDRPEWPGLDGPRDDWPMMGCGNLVRAEDWGRVGGYEEAFFLYRNDTDLALKLLDAGRGVHARREWIVWHDSPAATRKSERWLELATRNWCWMSRRHGRGAWKWIGILSGAAWACVQAGASPGRLRCVLRGAWDGVTKSPGARREENPRAGAAYARLVRMQLGRRARTA